MYYFHLRSLCLAEPVAVPGKFYGVCRIGNGNQNPVTSLVRDRLFLKNHNLILCCYRFMPGIGVINHNPQNYPGRSHNPDPCGFANTLHCHDGCKGNTYVSKCNYEDRIKHSLRKITTGLYGLITGLSNYFKSLESNVGKTHSDQEPGPTVRKKWLEV